MKVRIKQHHINKYIKWIARGLTWLGVLWLIGTVPMAGMPEGIS
jgi:hypothetical protein